MSNEIELKEYCWETKDIKVKAEPIEYDVNIDDKKVVLDAVETVNVKVEECGNLKREDLEIGDCTISCKVEPEEKYLDVCDVNEDFDMKYDPLLVTQNIEGVNVKGDILYNCPKCTYTSNSRYNYKRHVQRHDDIRKFVCTICNKRFYEKRKLRLHEFIHSGQKVFECDLCDYGAVRKDHFMRHVQNKHMKMDEKKYKCPKCNYQTNNKHHMGKHHFVHEEARPYVCNICNRQFKRACELKAHAFVHDEEKRFQCAHCDFKTNTKTYLVIHLRSKHLGIKNKEYECSECTFKTVYRSDLNRHFRRHLGEKKFKCPRCPYQTHQKPDLRRHNDLHDNPKSHKYLGISLTTWEKQDISMKKI